MHLAVLSNLFSVSSYVKIVLELVSWTICLIPPFLNYWGVKSVKIGHDFRPQFYLRHRYRKSKRYIASVYFACDLQNLVAFPNSENTAVQNCPCKKELVKLVESLITQPRIIRIVLKFDTLLHYGTLDAGKKIIGQIKNKLRIVLYTPNIWWPMALLLKFGLKKQDTYLSLSYCKWSVFRYQDSQINK